MALDYIIGAYPLVLIVVMYAMVELYSRNCRPVVLFGQILHHCCVRFRHELNIRTSLVDAFGTFFSLSFVKFLSTTMDMLTSTKLWDSKSNTTSQRLYFEGSVETVSGKHFVVAILVVLFCNLFPLLLMLIYSLPRAQILLNAIPISLQQLMYPFMDNIMACYKDGTNETRNCRYFAVVYHFALLLLASCFFVAKDTVVIGWVAFVCILIGMLVAVVQPYKSKVYNTVDTILVLSVGLCFSGAASSLMAYIEAPFLKRASVATLIAPFSIPLIYFVGYFRFKCFVRFRTLMVCPFHGQYLAASGEDDRQPLVSPSDANY